MRVVRLILLITILIFAVNVVEAKTYIVNFDYIGGVEVKTDSPFPKGWKRSGDLWGDDDSGWESPPNSYTAGQGSSYSQSDIDAVEALDGAYSRSSTTADDTALGADEEYAVHEFMFSVATSATYLEINAYVRDEDDGIQAYIWNFATNSWQLYADYSGTNINPMWINFSTSSPSSYISASGEVYVLFQSQARAGLWGSDTAYIDVDYVEAYVVVPDSSVQSACLNYISGAPRDWDGIFDDDQFSITFRVEDESGNGIPNYPGFIRLIWDSSYSDFAANWSNSSGYLTTTGKPIHGRVSDKWRVTFKGVIKDVMTNGVAYQYDSSCSQPIAAQNVAITPGSYDITLVGRIWDVGGADWVRIRWIAEPEDVDHVNKGGYYIPVSQHFHDWEFFLWKMGVVDPNNDDDGLTEGVYGTSNDVTGEGVSSTGVGSSGKYSYPACVGPDYDDNCGSVYRTNCQGECCYTDEDGAHDCNKYLSGYRFSTLIQFNMPDHAIGEIAATAVDTCNNIDTIKDIVTQPYKNQEGPGAIKCDVLNVGIGTKSTELAFREGWSILGVTVFRPDPHGALGMIGFVGLAADNQHVVGLLLGHRFGIHPSVALVTSVPEYPSDQAGWKNYTETWIYYLLRNLAYNIKVTAEEMQVWNLRYPLSGEDNILEANRVFNDLVIDFAPYLTQVVWLLQSFGVNVNHPYIVSTFTQLYDIGKMAKTIMNNGTLRDELGNVVGTAVFYLPNITGPPDASTALNYFLKYRLSLPYTERESVTYEIMKLVNKVETFLITIIHHIPIMEYSGPNNDTSPGWEYNWISNS